MKILKEIKQEDGSVLFNCDCTLEEIEVFASIGINTILKEYIEKCKKKEKKDDGLDIG